jgi:hypothetical protein
MTKKNLTSRLYEIGDVVRVIQDGYFRNFYGIIRDIRSTSLVNAPPPYMDYLVDFSKYDNPRPSDPPQVWFHHKKLVFMSSPSKLTYFRHYRRR